MILITFYFPKKIFYLFKPFIDTSYVPLFYELWAVKTYKAPILKELTFSEAKTGNKPRNKFFKYHVTKNALVKLRM